PPHPRTPVPPRPPPPRIEVRTVKALAARRHHPMALLVILLLALVATGGLYAALQPQTAQAEAYTESDVEAGEALFLANCATCHGRDAAGLTDADGSTLGPSLIGVGAAAVDFQVGTGRMPMQHSGAQAARKSPQMKIGRASCREGKKMID